MRLLLTGRQVDITPTLRRLVDARLAKLERRFGEALVSAQVVLSQEKNRFVAELAVHARQDHMLHGRRHDRRLGHVADGGRSESACSRPRRSRASGRNGSALRPQCRAPRSRRRGMTERSGVTVGELLQSRPDAWAWISKCSPAPAASIAESLVPTYRRPVSPSRASTSICAPGRVLVFGNSEVRYLESLRPADRAETMRKVCGHEEVPCILVTGGLRVFGEVIFEAERCHLPVLRTQVPTPVAIAKVTAILEDSFVVRELLHGVLLDILGLGVLIVGESGIGKSECALDLVVRGHRLVADDAVEVRRRAETILIGRALR